MEGNICEQCLFLENKEVEARYNYIDLLQREVFLCEECYKQLDEDLMDTEEDE